MAAGWQRERGEVLGSSADRGVPRVYDDFQDGDTRLDPRALMGGPLALGAGARAAGGTVLMPAAVSPMPVTIAFAPDPPASVVVTRSPAQPAQRRKNSSAPVWEFTALEIAVGAAAIVIFGVVVAILTVQFT